MTGRPWSPLEVQERIFLLRRKLDDTVTSLYTLAHESAEATRAFKVGRAQEFLKARTSYPDEKVDERRARVDAAVADLEFEETIAQERYRTAREIIRVGLAELSMLQTMAVSHRQLMDG